MSYATSGTVRDLDAELHAAPGRLTGGHKARDVVTICWDAWPGPDRYVEHDRRAQGDWEPFDVPRRDWFAYHNTLADIAAIWDEIWDDMDAAHAKAVAAQKAIR